MSLSKPTILIADPDPRARSFLARQLEPLEATILEAQTGRDAVEMLAREPVKLLITELYLETDEDKCLILAIRRTRPESDIRIVAHTHRLLDEDRDWALLAGADAYLIKPTRAQRVRYVAGRLLAARPVTVPPPNSGPALRRESLDAALAEIEHGVLSDTSCIVFDRTWWQALASSERLAYRARAKAVRVSLRSDALIGEHHVEIRGRFQPTVGHSSEQPESPYRR